MDLEIEPKYDDVYETFIPIFSMISENYFEENYNLPEPDSDKSSLLNNTTYQFTF